MSVTPPSDNLQRAVRLASIRPKQGLGQNFLIDEASLDLIAATAAIKPEETVLEVGPGLGFLTTKLTPRAAQVVAVEADQQLAEILTLEAPANLRVITDDILEFDLTTLPKSYKVVANIPYYLTSKLLRLLMENQNPPSSMTLLIQKEVAERITAEPGQLSILALSVQYYAYAKIVGIVERHKFWPSPNVDSAIITITRRPKPAFPADATKLFRIIKAGFGERRKQLKNSLAGGLNADGEAITRVLAQANIEATRRAQELTLDDWKRLYAAVTKENLV